MEQTTAGTTPAATDTGAGKTTLLRQLIPSLEKAGIDLRIRKPVESGCTLENGRLIAHDATLLAAASIRQLSPEQVCPYRLRNVASPARAAQLESVELTIGKLMAACAAPNDTNSLLLVEGAGGLYSPIAQDGLNADLAGSLKVPLLIVVEDRLGCINHALLSIEAARRRCLRITALVLNQVAHVDNADTDNFAELEKLTDIPMFRSSRVDTRRLKQTREMEMLAQHIISQAKAGNYK